MDRWNYLLNVCLNVSYCAPLSVALPTAVSVARTTNVTEAADPLSFLDVVVDVGDGWDRFVQKLILIAATHSRSMQPPKVLEILLTTII